MAELYETLLSHGGYVMGRLSGGRTFLTVLSLRAFALGHPYGCRCDTCWPYPPEPYKGPIVGPPKTF